MAAVEIFIGGQKGIINPRAFVPIDAAAAERARDEGLAAPRFRFRQIAAYGLERARCRGEHRIGGARDKDLTVREQRREQRRTRNELAAKRERRRTEKRRVGKEWSRRGRSRGSQVH